MRQILLQGGWVIDSGNKIDKVTDLLIRGNIVSKLDDTTSWELRICDKLINCKGKLVIPGLIDMHVHFRTPGFEHKEDLDSGAKAAIAGGFTTVLCMANTNPVIDMRSVFDKNYFEMKKIKGVDLFQVCAATYGLRGEQVVDFYRMRGNGALAFSDDGVGLNNLILLEKAAYRCALHEVPLILHLEDTTISDNGVMALGKTSQNLKVKGIPREAEIYPTYVAIQISEITGCHIHLQHLSCKESVELVRQAKKNGVKITAETCPHYLSLTDHDVIRLGANGKMNPPLRGPADQLALKEGIIDGTIDVIATDHAPHTPEEKSHGLVDSPFGIIGLETAVPVVFTAFYNAIEAGRISYSDLIAKMTINPAKILGMDTNPVNKGKIEPGYAADITVIDPKQRKKVDPSKFYSKSRNCPWAGKRLQGWPIMTIHNGEIVMKDGEVLV